MGTQTSWQPDWGWGALDLTSALDYTTADPQGPERLDSTRSVREGSARFYSATVQSAGDRATLVWNRRAQGCVGPGCSPTAFTLTNLELRQLDPDSGAVQAQSTSSIDNVEQLRAPGASAGQEVLYMVHASSSVDGLPSEPYALASQDPLTPIVSPDPTATVSVSPGQVEPGQTVTVSATIANPSDRIPAQQAQATLELPAGVELVSGSPTEELGTLAAGGQASRTWTIRAASAGAHQVTVRTSATYATASFGASGSAALNVVPSTATGEPPSPTTPTETAPSGPSVPVQPIKSSPRLRIFSARVRRGRVRIAGSISPQARGRVSVVYTTRIAGRTIRIHRLVRHRGGRLSLTIRLPRGSSGRGRVRASYGGDAALKPQTARASVR